MKTLTTAFVLSLSVLAAGAQAAGVDQGPTRAQVQAELQQAKATGQYAFGEQDYPVAVAQTSSLTSQQVFEQLQQARAAGLVTTANLDYPPVVATPVAGKTRAQVQAELAQARLAGLVTFGNLDYPPVGS